MPRPTGLQAQVLEASFKAGLQEKIAPEMAAPEGAYLLENAELDKLGIYQRRRGLKPMTTAAVAPSTFGSFGTPKKVGGRDDELWVIAEESGYLGSGGGSGNSGAIVWSYSPGWDAWEPHAKVPSTTCERVVGLMNGQVNPKWVAAGYCYKASDTSHRFIVLAYNQETWSEQAPGVHALVYDAVSLTPIKEDTLLLQVASQEMRMQVVSLGRYVVIVARQETFAAGTQVTTQAWVYDAQGTNTFAGPFNLISNSRRGGRGWTISTDGTYLYWLEICDGVVGGGEVGGAQVDRDVNILQYGPVSTASLNFVAIRKIGAADGDSCYPGLSYTGGRLHATYKRANTHPGYVSATSILSASTAPIDVSANALPTGPKVLNVGISVDEACVFWTQGANYSVATPKTQLYWRWIKTGSTAPAVRANTHFQTALRPLSHPFVMNTRVYIALTGDGAPPNDGTSDTAGSNLGHILAEVNSLTSSEDLATGNPYSLVMPEALWAKDLSLCAQGPALIAPGSDGDVYIASVREARKSDEIFSEGPMLGGGQPKALAHSIAVWSLDVLRIAFADPKRYAHAEMDQEVVIACSLPYAYNGDRAHECGYIFRPIIETVTENTVGTVVFTAGEKTAWLSTYEWEDSAGRRWLSEPSYPYFMTAVSGKGYTVEARPPWVTMKPDGSFNFTGRVRTNIYRALRDSPDQWDLIFTGPYMIWDAGGLFDFTLASVQDTRVDYSSTEKAYMTGGELSNYVAPSCRSLIQHRDRFFAIDLEDNSLAFTKPYNRGRGVEWSRFHKKPLPQRGMALGSIEGSLIVFTDKAILVLEGQGPSSTGIPPDAFARFAVLSQDQGCSEVNAAWRTPRGIVFRSRQGLWIVTPQLGIQYVGAMVEEFVRDVDYFVDGTLDEKMGCLRLLAKMATHTAPQGTYAVLVWWYDSDRWSVDQYVRSAQTGDGITTMRSSTVHLGQYYVAADASVLKRTDSYYMDGSTNKFDPSHYQMSFRSGWFRFDSISNFKRLWRVQPHVKLAALGAAVPDSHQDLQIVIETDGDPVKVQTDLLRANDFAPGGVAFDGTLETHVKFQKGQRYRITLTESMGLPYPGTGFAHPVNGPVGYAFVGVGFELGMKPGAAKLGGERSPR